MLTRTCLCLLTRGEPGRRELLLGLKKRGFGTGKWVGLGGHIEPGETPEQAAAREVAEESGLVVEPQRLVHMAALTFLFPARPGWDCSADVFAAPDFAGEAAESGELVPRWFGVDALPLAGMWDDARYWLPRVLAGEQVRATVTFAADCATVARIVPGSSTAVAAAAAAPGSPAALRAPGEAPGA